MREINNAKQESTARSVLKLIRSLADRETPLLVVLCGPSQAGKTTFAKSLRKHFRIVSSEEIRKEIAGCFEHTIAEAKVWKVFEAMKRQWLKQGDNVVLDACQMSRQARWHSVQGPNGQHRKICVVFDLPLWTVRARCLKTQRVSLDEVERMWKDFQRNKPDRAELKSLGFDEVYFVK